MINNHLNNPNRSVLVKILNDLICCPVLYQNLNTENYRESSLLRHTAQSATIFNDHSRDLSIFHLAMKEIVAILILQSFAKNQLMSVFFCLFMKSSLDGPRWFSVNKQILSCAIFYDCEISFITQKITLWPKEILYSLYFVAQGSTYSFEMTMPFRLHVLMH